MKERERQKETERQKEAAALKAAEFVRDGMTLGLGTGSTAFYLIRRVGELVASGMRLRAVVTSLKTAELAERFGIPAVKETEAVSIDLAIDGVDEIDPLFYAVKGGGGALAREKIIACRADDVVWIMDESKLVDRLGAFPLPVEILEFGWTYTADSIRELGFCPALRMAGSAPFRSDNGNLILDLVQTGAQADYRTRAALIKALPGVVETGLFGPVCSRIVVGRADGAEVIERGRM